MKVVVCICTCKRAGLLERLLRSLAGINLGNLRPEQVSIVVVDNSPSGEVRRVCEEVAAILPLALLFVEERRRGISFARNTAVEQGLALDADLIAFIDDDDIPEPDWLLRLIEKQQAKDADLVFGAWRWIESPGTPSWLRQSGLFESSRVEQLNDYDVPNGGTCNVLISRRILQILSAAGDVFRPEFALTGGEDVDFFIRSVRHGGTFAVARNSVINRHQEDVRQSLRGALRRAFRFGSASVFIASQHGRSERIRRDAVKALKSVLWQLVRMPTRLSSKERVVGDLCSISRKLGVVMAASGKTFNYYH